MIRNWQIARTLLATGCALTLAVVLGMGCKKSKMRDALTADQLTLIKANFDDGPEPGLLQLDDMIFHISELEPVTPKQSSSGAFVQYAISGVNWNLKRSSWPNGVVPIKYVDAVTQAQKNLLAQAFAEWSNVSGVTLRDYNPSTDTVRLDLTTGMGGRCVAQVGTGPQGSDAVSHLNLGSGCWDKGTILHELGHVLGLLHEHQRPDRDTYVTVLQQNLQRASAGDVMNIIDSSSGQVLTAYDLQSIMHYQYNSYAKAPGLDTILPRDSTVAKSQLGSARAAGKPTQSDIDGIVQIYPSGNAPPVGTIFSAASFAAGNVKLAADQGILSPNNRYELYVPANCHLEIYDLSKRNSLAQKFDYPPPPVQGVCDVEFMSGQLLILVNGSLVASYGSSGKNFQLNDLGQVVLTDTSGSTIIESYPPYPTTGTIVRTLPSTISKTLLNAGEGALSPNKHYELFLDNDGTLEILDLSNSGAFVLRRGAGAPTPAPTLYFDISGALTYTDANSNISTIFTSNTMGTDIGLTDAGQLVVKLNDKRYVVVADGPLAVSYADLNGNGVVRGTPQF